MAQYKIYTDGTDSFREGVRNGSYVVDVEITEAGFAGIENIDWENIEELKPQA